MMLDALVWFLFCELTIFSCYAKRPKMNQTRKHSFERMNKCSLKAQRKTYKMLQAQQSKERKNNMKIHKKPNWDTCFKAGMQSMVDLRHSILASKSLEAKSFKPSGLRSGGWDAFRLRLACLRGTQRIRMNSMLGTWTDPRRYTE